MNLLNVVWCTIWPMWQVQMYFNAIDFTYMWVVREYKGLGTAPCTVTNLVTTREAIDWWTYLFN